MQKYATYENVNPPEIKKDWFNKPSLLEDFYDNPISQMYSDYVIPTQTKTEEVVAAPENDSPEKKSSEKRKQAKKIVSEKVTVPSSFQSNQQFAQIMDKLYKNELSKNGLDPNLSTMLVAQDALETSWGKSVKGKFNYGNITTNGNDWTTKTGNRKWKDFKSLEDYITYKVSFLSNNRYQFFTYATMNNVSSSMQNLANRGYDPGNPQYGSRVADVVNTVRKYLS